MRVISLLFIFTVILVSCVTQKHRGDVSKFNKFYHNTTAYYNGYFNANLLMEESFELLEAQVSDNYNQPLDLFKYAAAENPQAVYANLDKVIEKVSVAVHLHRVSNWTDDCYLMLGQAQFLKQDYESAQETLEYFLQEFDETGQSKSVRKRIKTSPTKQKSERQASAKKARKEKVQSQKQKEKEEKKARKAREKERQKDIKSRQQGRSSNKKIDPRQARAIREARREQARQDSIAAATAELKKEQAQQETQVAAAEKVNPEPSKKDKKGSNPDTTPTGQEYNPESYFMKHKPCYQEALVWLAKTYVMRSNYDNARMYLKQLENDPRTSEEVRADIAVVEAFSYMRQKNFSSAIGPLIKAVELEGDRIKRARYAYVLAQLQEMNGNYREANDSYERVVRIRPDFELEFHAKLGLIRTNQLSGSMSQDAVASEIKRLIREKKYEQHKGELLYNLAVLQIKSGDIAAGQESLKNALASSGNGPATLTEINYMLATIYYDKKEYIDAKRSYDATLSSMNKIDDRRPVCERRSKSLTEIASNLSIIAEKDSLLKVAQMSPEEKKELAMKLKQKREADLLTNSSPADLPAKSGSSTFMVSGSRPPFFAYDSRNMQKNKRDFDRMWQNRTLEDNWRRSNKTSSSLDDDSDPALAGRSTSGEISDKEMDDLLSGVPKTPEEEEALGTQVMEAMFALGGLFRDKLDQNELSTEYLEQLLERFPDTQYQPDAYYRLFINYKDLGNPAKSEYYKSLILQKHPQSLYAEVIRDPDYFRKKREEENKLNNYYASTYDFFSSGNFEKAYDMSHQATEVFGPDNQLKAKFALIKAMCVGKISGSDQYMHALREVIAKYPNTEEQTRAREILRLLGQRTGMGMAAVDQEPTAPSASIYTNGDDEMHYVIVVLQSKEISLNDAKIIVSKYNSKYHKLDNLKISNIVLGEKNNLPVVVLRRFESKTQAMKYFEGTRKNKRDFIQDPTLYEMFAISQTNYRQLITTRAIEPYREFFLKTYL
jgi:tetratricopeptide (TPR) repeat protein